jgi:WD40 repeat protein
LTARGQQVQLWDAGNGRLVRELAEPFFISGFALAPDGKQFAIAGYAGSKFKQPVSEIRVYDLASGKVVRSFARDGSQFRTNPAFSPDGKRLFSLGRDGILRVEDIATGKELLRKSFPENRIGGEMCVSTDGKYLAIMSGPNARELFLWDWQADAPRKLKGPEYGARGPSFSAHGKLLAAVDGVSGSLYVWQVPSGGLLYRQAPSDEGYAYSGTPAFTPDGKSLALFLSRHNGRTGGKIQLLDPATGGVQATFGSGGGSLAISPDSKRLAISYGVGVRIWDLESRQEVGGNDAAHSSYPSRIAVSPTGIVVTAGDDQSVRIWDAGSGKQRHKFQVDGWVRDISLSPDGKFLTASSLDDAVHVWETASGREVYRLAGHGELGGRRTLGFLPDGRGFLSWGDDFYLRLWNVKNGKALLEHAIRPSGVTVPDEDNPRGKEVFDMGQAVIALDARTMVLDIAGNFYLFDTDTGKERFKFPSRGGFSNHIAISPDGKWLLVSSWARAQANHHHVELWGLSNGKLLQQHLVPGSSAGPVAFAADGRSFATAVNVPQSSPQREIHIFESCSGKVRSTIRGFAGQVHSLAFFPDGKRLASGLSDSSVLIWDLARAASIDKGQ